MSAQWDSPPQLTAQTSPLSLARLSGLSGGSCLKVDPDRRLHHNGLVSSTPPSSFSTSSAGTVLIHISQKHYTISTYQHGVNQDSVGVKHMVPYVALGCV